MPQFALFSRTQGVIITIIKVDRQQLIRCQENNIDMDIQNLISGFTVSLLTFIFGIAAAFLLRKKLFRTAPKKSTATS